MEEIQGGHCPCSQIQGGQPTTLPPPCRAPANMSTQLCTFIYYGVALSQKVVSGFDIAFDMF